jgi:hypothetical protein
MTDVHTMATDRSRQRRRPGQRDVEGEAGLPAMFDIVDLLTFVELIGWRRWVQHPESAPGVPERVV